MTELEWSDVQSMRTGGSVCSDLAGASLRLFENKDQLEQTD
jgi:hypothetical protein